MTQFNGAPFEPSFSFFETGACMAAIFLGKLHVLPPASRILGAGSWEQFFENATMINRAWVRVSLFFERFL